MQSVLIMQYFVCKVSFCVICYICKVSLLCSAFYAKCPLHYVCFVCKVSLVLYMLYMHSFYRHCFIVLLALQMSRAYMYTPIYTPLARMLSQSKPLSVFIASPHIFAVCVDRQFVLLGCCSVICRLGSGTRSASGHVRGRIAGGPEAISSLQEP